ncbi:PREDICTED: epidermal retinol dehydrogenase 2-like [Chaetura pelagica]|uniref:epidermal retinol dehydrogenase 2-like n=2 Tax=Chaetura pelagica TaxID=8897 RepID=UPI000523C828|nr:PREDICTED: epidermal retinol dehydrogenase 2-like [Chaetura pelagica]
MNFFLETLKVIGLSFYYFLESLVFLIVPKRKKNVSGEIVLVTGAGSGIGRLLSLKFASLGATVVLWDINQEGLKETSRLVKQNGAVRVHCYICDCSKREDIYRVADQVKKEVGDVTILVNNAGVVTGKTFLDAPDPLVEKTMEVNIMAHFWTYKAFLPAMIASNHGHLVSIASSAGLVGVNRLSDVFSSRWPNLLPLLDPEYVAEKIVTAIRQDQVILVLPRFGYLVMFLKSILPVKTAILLADYLGILNLMDNFKGRAKKD